MMSKKSSNENLNLICFIFLLINDEAFTLSFNQPKFCPTASWQTNAATVANITMLGVYPIGLFIDNNNTIYANDRTNNRTLIWSEGSSIPTKIIWQNRTEPGGIFVTDSGDIYIDNGAVNGRVDKWTKNATMGVPVMYVNSSCFGLFVDSNNSLYCSLYYQHQVVKISLNNNTPNMTMVFGNGTPASTSNTLHGPTSIYVDVNFDLYVADTDNSRIQLFKSGQTNGITLVENGSSSNMILYHPSGVMMDGNGYLFIVDRLNSSVIRSGPDGFFCVAACSGTSGSNSDQLNIPYSLAFDRFGNIFVMDEGNNRIQKFMLATNSCVSYNQPKLCPNATWNPNAITFADNITIHDKPRGIYVDIDDRIFFAAYSKQSMLIWLNGSSNSMQSIPANLSNYTTLFTSVNGDIYFETNNEVGRIDKMAVNGNSSEFVTKFNSSCYGLFIDINNTLYCSMNNQHQVVSCNTNNTSVYSIVAGEYGISGAALNQLDNPWGIFIDINFDLYVADAGNDRIQLFQQGQLNGTTLAGGGIPNGLIFYIPTDVILDANDYLFVADDGNSRIIRVGPTNYDCVAGCSGSLGTAAYQLYKPVSLRFDTQGNLYVADEYNYRVQKFTLATNSCGISTMAISTIDYEISSSSTIQQKDATTQIIEEMFFTSVTSDIPTTQLSSSLSPSYSFTPSSCPNQTYIGTNCNIPSTLCDINQPCQNNGTCKNVNTTLLGYICSCPLGFNGSQCEFDDRPCKTNTCWNNGICENTSDSTFICGCMVGWQGVHCETKINYCENITCLNGGVCQPLLRDYKCACLGNSFSGRYCQITDNKIQLHQVLGKSFAYIAITVMISAGMFIVIMDLLKYCFGINVTRPDMKKKRKRKERPKKRKGPPVIVRYTYVHRPQSTSIN